MINNRVGRQNKNQGFTLIEILVAVLILGILASFAMASYENSVIKSKRRAAGACLLEHAQYLERYHTTRLTYDGAQDPAPLSCIASLGDDYEFEMELTADTYTLTASPVSEIQQKDSCGEISLNHLNQKDRKSVV